MYLPSYPGAIVYMLQSTEYRVGPYLRWYWRTTNFSSVARRRTLDKTKSARMLINFMQMGIILQVLLGLWLLYRGLMDDFTGGVQFGIAIILAYPVVWAHLIALPLALGRLLVVKPKERALISESHKTFKKHTATTIAVAGSYGKTTVKELLATVLAEGKKVAATPANKNVSVSHAKFAKLLAGDEDVLIIEYGEGAPGDVEKFARNTHPDIAVITGLAPAHLDRYKTLENAGRDIFSLKKFVRHSDMYVNGESGLAKPFIHKDYKQYSVKGVDGWRISGINIGIDSTSFTMKKGVRTLKLKSGLIGRHMVGPLAVTAAIADRLGLKIKQIEAGVAKTKPFEHRMEPYNLRGAWLIDDTYNGNIEGIAAGLELLKELKGKRKVYISPGLVDQGKETKDVHVRMGRLIAKSKPDKIYLMDNSVTDFIKEGMKKGGYKGEVTVVKDPLKFYTSLDQILAAGDIIMMQNDWTDNYN